MKRDMSLVREILLEIEKGRTDEQLFDVLDYPMEDIIYHIKIMNDYGLIEASVVEVFSINYKGEADFALETIKGLTWEGYDFLDDIRDETVWKKTMAQIKKTTGTASLEMVKEVAKGASRNNLPVLGLQVGQKREVVFRRALSRTGGTRPDSSARL